MTNRRIGKHITAAERGAIDALLRGGASVTETARSLGFSRTTVTERKRMLGQEAGVRPEAASDPVARTEVPPPPETPETRREVRDADFWRRRARTLETQLASIERTMEEVAGVRNQAISVPAWLLERSDEKRRSVVGLLLTDIHAGEVIDGDEILGLNAYDADICRRRLRRLFSAACSIPPRWTRDCRNQGFLLALGGDLISGSIHQELTETNALTAHEQVRLVVEEVSAGIRHLLEAYGRVHVASVPGNHGRTTMKPTAKLYARLSYDTLAASMIQDRFEADARVTFQIGSSPDAIIPILGYTVFLSHGDKIGTGGGQALPGRCFPSCAEPRRSRRSRRGRGVARI